MALLIEGLDDPDRKTPAVQSLATFAEVAPSEVQPLLLKLAESQADNDRYLAVEALGSLKTAESAQALVNVLNSDQTEIQTMAVYSLGRLHIGPGLCVPTLASALKSKDPHVGIAAAAALGEFGEAAAPAVPRSWNP